MRGIRSELVTLINSSLSVFDGRKPSIGTRCEVPWHWKWPLIHTPLKSFGKSQNDLRSPAAPRVFSIQILLKAWHLFFHKGFYVYKIVKLAFWNIYGIDEKRKNNIEVFTWWQFYRIYPILPYYLDIIIH